MTVNTKDRSAEDLLSRLRRHVGHELQCRREITEIGGYRLEAVALICNTCAEGVIEATARMKRARR